MKWHITIILSTRTVAPRIRIVNATLDITVDEIGHMNSVSPALRVMEMQQPLIHAFQAARAIQ